MPAHEERIAALEARNIRVEDDKAWEVSWTRRFVVASLIYFCAFWLLLLLGHEDAWRQALVPVFCYFLSTLSVPVAKTIWLRWRGCA